MPQLEILRGIVESKPETYIKPIAFFLKWSAVPVLVYEAYSEALLLIQSELDVKVSELKPRNPGSRLPATTVGAMMDDGKLSLDEAWKILDICEEHSRRIPEDLLEVDKLRVVIYRTKSLEERLCCFDLSLREPAEEYAPPGVHRKEVQCFLDNFTAPRLPDYLPYLQRTDSRISRYRSRCIGTSLVFDVPEDACPYLQAFRDAVDDALPGRFEWFESDSLHLTVRSLAGR